MRAVLAVVAALAVTVALGETEEESSKCRWTDTGDVNIACSLPSAYVTIEATVNEVVNFECENGGVLRCEELQRLQLARNETLPNLGVVGCALPETLSCLLASLGATDVGTVTFKDVTDDLRLEHVAGLRHVEKLMLFNADGQKSFPIGVINALPSLRHFRLNGGGALQLQGVEFRRDSRLEYLEVSNRDIPDLPSDIFQGLSELKTLNLWGNNIKNISVDAFKGLASLRLLSLNSNTLETLPVGLFAHMPQLREISLWKNMLGNISAGVLSNLPQLRSLEISKDERIAELKLASKALSRLPALTNLRLDDCNITSLPPDLFLDTNSLVNITLSYNSLEHLPEELFNGQVYIERLDLSHNKLKEVTQKMFASLRALKEINLDRNNIEILPNRLFSGLTNLKSVSLNRNRLRVISSAAFQGATSIEELTMSSNNLSWFEEYEEDVYLNLGVQSPFSGLEKLRRLNLAKNNISYTFSDWRYVLIQNLEYLDLSHNSFTILTQADVQYLNSEITVDLRYNRIATILPDTDAYLADGHTRTNKLTILLDHNPFECDCYLYQFIKELNKSSGTRFNVNNGRCNKPTSLREALLTEVTPADLACSAPTCPDRCRCDFRPDTDRIEFDCETVPFGLPTSSSLDFDAQNSSLRLRRVSTPMLHVDLPSHVRELYAAGLGLRDISLAQNSLTYIDLSRNEFARPPLDVLAANVTVRLAQNPLQCDCGSWSDVAALQRHRELVRDYLNVSCADGGLVAHVDSRLCDAWYAQLMGGTLVTLSLLIAVAAFLWYWYSLEFRLFLITRFPWCYPEERLDADKPYDAFVSFAHGDEVTVIEELIPRLEGECGLTLCVHYRDWEVGELIPTQIIRSVERSRRTIVVLSKNFLASVWAKLEFRAAHVKALQERRTRVVVVLLEEVADDERIDDELRAYLTTNTYVKWGDPWFWEKLRDALPRRGGARRAGRRRVRSPLDKIARGGLDVVLTMDGKLTNAAFVEDPLVPVRSPKCNIDL